MTPFLSLRGWFKQPEKIKVKLVQTNSLSLSMKDWRENEELVAGLAKVSQLPVFEAMMQTLRNESPLNYVATNAAPHDIIKHLGEIQGYQCALNNIEALTKLAKANEPLVATFEPPTNEQE